MEKLFDDSRGVTLVELLVVVSIITILLVALAFSYSGWQGKYKVESQTRQIYADILYARTRAMQTGRTHFMEFLGSSPYSSYKIVEDTNENGAEDSPPDDTVLQTKTLLYPVWWANGSGTSRCTRISFSTKGLVGITDIADCQTPKNIAFVKTSTVQGVAPDANCISVEQTRVNVGQMPYDPNTAFSASSTCNAR